MAARLDIPFLVLVLALGGCVLPNRLAEKDPFREDIVGFIEPGITSKATVEDRLGVQHLASPDDQWWVYPADRRLTEWLWFICTPGGCDGAEFGGDVHRYNLIVEFDNDHKVRQALVVTDQTPCNVDQSICLENNELTVVEGENRRLLSLEYDTSRTPCAFLLRDKGYESEGFLGELLASPGTECYPALTMRDGLVYALEAEKPYTGRLTVSGVKEIGKVERLYEGGYLNGIEAAWSESGEKLYEANYKDNLLHGPVTYWKLDGTIAGGLCFENGQATFRDLDECAR